jgi:hypothetical protein
MRNLLSFQSVERPVTLSFYLKTHLLGLSILSHSAYPMRFPSSVIELWQIMKPFVHHFRRYEGFGLEMIVSNSQKGWRFGLGQMVSKGKSGQKLYKMDGTNFIFFTLGIVG